MYVQWMVKAGSNNSFIALFYSTNHFHYKWRNNAITNILTKHYWILFAILWNMYFQIPIKHSIINVFIQVNDKLKYLNFPSHIQNIPLFFVHIQPCCTSEIGRNLYSCHFQTIEPISSIIFIFIFLKDLKFSVFKVIWCWWLYKLN